MTTDTVKKTLRKQARAARADAFAAFGGAARGNLRSGGLAFLGQRTPGTVSGFYPYQKEIDTTGLLERLAEEGWITALPVVLAPATPLEFRAWRPGEPLVPDTWDIPIPTEGAKRVTPDVLLVPLLAFDRAGYRLGYGGGFYDRTLQHLRRRGPVTAVGVAFSAQEVESVARDAHDEPLDWMLTEKGPFRCMAGAERMEGGSVCD